MDWTVQLQLLRRGGLKGKPALNADQVSTQMEQLRQANKDKTAENIAEGKRMKAAHGKGKDQGKVAGEETGEDNPAKVGRGAPEEFTDFMPTEAEGELANWMQNGGAKFFQDQDAHTETRAVEPTEVRSPEAVERLLLMKEVNDSKLTGRLEGDLATYVNNKLLLHRERSPEAKLTEEVLRAILEEARDQGTPDLSSAADQLLTNGVIGKVGFSQEVAALSSFSWTDGVGRGTFRYKGASWSVYDYGDQLPISVELMEILDLNDIQCQREEARQCLFLHCTAGVLLSREGAVPSVEHVQEATGEVRAETSIMARGAAYHLGPCPAEIGKSEADLRVFAHDILNLDHDKDYRCLAAFPPSLYEGHDMHIVRMDPHGSVTTEIIHHAGRNKTPREVWLLVHKGHMRLLNRPPSSEVPKVVRSVEAAGWEIHLEAVEGPEACVRARDLAKCPRCDEAAGDPLRIGERQPATLGLYPLPPPEQKIGGWVQGPLESTDLIG